MDSTVRTRPNHYAVLGIKPTASDEEIAQAFIGKMFSPRPMTQAALIGAAYETLRNPAKRRAYDASLGFRPEPQVVLSKPLVSFHATARYLPIAPAISFEQGAAEPAPVVPRPEPEAVSDEAPEPVDFGAFLEAGRDEREKGAFEWRKPAVIAAGLVAAVGLVGAWAGSIAGNDVEAEQVTMALPKAKPAGQAPATAAAPAAVAAAPKFDEVRFNAPPRRAERARSRPQPARDRLADVKQALKQHSYYTTIGADGTAEIAAADAPTPPAPDPAMVAAASSAAASMPLSNGTIARTIHKIGYSCGQVASMTPVDGQAGAFTVTCTSGKSYRAFPVKGRYRFRKM